jgi:ABC-type sugar transport system ATPase subunit
VGRLDDANPTAAIIGGDEWAAGTKSKVGSGSGNGSGTEGGPGSEPGSGSGSGSGDGLGDATGTGSLLVAHAVSKRFGGIQAVDDVSFALQAGSVHGLVGENGAGKSTLAKILGGVHRPDAGDLLLDGRPVRFGSPRDALAAGVATIAQELALVPARTVAENVFLGAEPRRLGVLDEGALRRRFDDLNRRTGFGLDPDARVRDLRVADQQKVEILRAVARDARVILMDEPTASLTADETQRLLAIVRQLAAAGTAVVLVSHFLDEVLAVSSEVTVMRDGKVVRSGPAAAETEDTLVQAMIGRRLETAFPERRPLAAEAPVVLRADGLRRRGAIGGDDGIGPIGGDGSRTTGGSGEGASEGGSGGDRRGSSAISGEGIGGAGGNAGSNAAGGVSFEIRAGEILGLAGLVGSGRTEIARALFGADQLDAGTVSVDGRPVRLRHPGDAIAAGIAMLPESRKEQGLHLARAVRENETMASLRRFAPRWVIDGRKERAAARQAAADLGVRAASIEDPVVTLSGGNQQKVLFAKWLMRRPRVLIADEPTRGVDVGAKRQIYDLLQRLAGDGMAVLLISSEIEEVLGLSNRVLVLRAGRVVAEFAGGEANKDRVMAAAFGAVHHSGETTATPAATPGATPAPGESPAPGATPAGEAA